MPNEPFPDCRYRKHLFHTQTHTHTSNINEKWKGEVEWFRLSQMRDFRLSWCSWFFIALSLRTSYQSRLFELFSISLCCGQCNHAIRHMYMGGHMKLWFVGPKMWWNTATTTTTPTIRTKQLPLFCDRSITHFNTQFCLLLVHNVSYPGTVCANIRWFRIIDVLSHWNWHTSLIQSSIPFICLFFIFFFLALDTIGSVEVEEITKTTIVAIKIEH